MSYATHAAIVQSGSLRLRITACAAQEGVTDPPRWVNAVVWSLPQADWLAAWASAEAANPGADHGSDEAVITDQMILSSVQAQIADTRKDDKAAK